LAGRAAARSPSCALILHRPLRPRSNVEDEDEKVVTMWYDKISEQDEGKEDISSTSLLKLRNK
jgi:hypothetical protein